MVQIRTRLPLALILHAMAQPLHSARIGWRVRRCLVLGALMLGLAACAGGPPISVSTEGAGVARATYVLAGSAGEDHEDLNQTLGEELRRIGLTPALVSQPAKYVVHLAYASGPGRLGAYPVADGGDQAEPNWLLAPTKPSPWRPFRRGVYRMELMFVDAATGRQVFRSQARQFYRSPSGTPPWRSLLSAALAPLLDGPQARPAVQG